MAQREKMQPVVQGGAMFNIEEELKKLPKEPGVYIMRDDKDVILYVGKAVNLHNRQDLPLY